ncbi:MAG: TRL-like family protein [Myxococcales bacterium]|nr:TRL-like family protein [Myxococcales bacterium]
MRLLPATALTALFLTGCAAAMPGNAPPPGVIFNGAAGVGPNTRVEASDGERPGPKRGEACTSGVLGLAAWGDMSLDAAKKAGSITTVDTIDYKVMEILGVVYAKHCTVITGR